MHFNKAFFQMEGKKIKKDKKGKRLKKGDKNWRKDYCSLEKVETKDIGKDREDL